MSTSTCTGNGQSCVDHAPTFTAEDERRERAGLTVRDVCEIEADLRGLVLDEHAAGGLGGGPASATGSIASNGVERGRAKSSCAHATSAHINSDSVLLSQLHEEMNKLEKAYNKHVHVPSTFSSSATDTMQLPPTSAYRQAQRRCPDQLTNDRLLAFLETEKGDAARAAWRLARYWNYRLDLFGESRCYRPMTLLPGGAMEDEVENLSVRRIYEPLPGNITDEAGRSIIHCVPSRRNFAEYSVAQEMQALFYICETILQDPNRRRAGLVAIMDGRNMRRQHFSREMGRYSSIFRDVLPIRLRAHHLCHPSAIHFYVIVPASKFLSPRENRLRFVMHCGSEEHVLNELAMYRLPRHCIPTSLGGTAVLDMNQWVLDRLVTEQREAVMATTTATTIAPEAGSLPLFNMHADDLPLRQYENPLDEANGPTAKRVRVDTPSTGAAIAGAVPSSSSSSSSSSLRPTNIALHSDAKKLSGRPRGKGAGRGRSDPRMDQAIKLKIADPNISLMDALVGGGFVFNDQEDGEVIDADGVRLTQVSTLNGVLHEY